MDQLQEIIDGRLTGFAAAVAMRAAVLELHDLDEKSRVLNLRIKRAETVLIYGAGGRPKDPHLGAQMGMGGITFTKHAAVCATPGDPEKCGCQTATSVSDHATNRS